MEKEKDLRAPTGLRLTPEVHALLKKQAVATERTVSQLIRFAIREYLAQSRESRANN